jgi:hypothetical protein
VNDHISGKRDSNLKQELLNEMNKLTTSKNDDHFDSVNQSTISELKKMKVKEEECMFLKQCSYNLTDLAI